MAHEVRPQIEFWNGSTVKIGHLGQAQHDLNLSGHVFSDCRVASLTCSLNGGEARALNLRRFRRIVQEGDFNADIPMSELAPGLNHILFKAVDERGNMEEKTVGVRLESGSSPFPVAIDFTKGGKPEEFGLATDGKWTVDAEGLRNVQAGYDRVFLIGETGWQDYEATALMAINGFSDSQGGQSGNVNHAGFCMRWQGHSLEDNLPGEQPKWGLHPRGGIVWLTYRDRELPPYCEFFPGDSEEYRQYGRFQVDFGEFFWMKGRCETLPDLPGGAGVTRYSFKVWREHENEPTDWTFTAVQESRSALRSGGLALVAHETFAVFRRVSITQVLPERVS